MMDYRVSREKWENSAEGRERYNGYFLGVIIASLINVLLREIIFVSSLNHLDYSLTSISIAFGVCFGFFMPLVANFLPIKQSMSKNLRNALDLSRSNKADSVGIKI